MIHYRAGSLSHSHSNVGSMIVGREQTERASAISEVSDKTSFSRGAIIEPRQEVSLGLLLVASDASEQKSFTVKGSDDVTVAPGTDVLNVDNVLGDLLDQLQEVMRHSASHANGQSQPDTDEKVESILHQMHSLEQLGIGLPNQLNEEDAIHQRILDGIRWIDGRYEVGLPWRTADGKAPSNNELPENFADAFACLQALTKPLNKSPDQSKVTKECQYTTHYLSH